MEKKNKSAETTNEELNLLDHFRQLKDVPVLFIDELEKVQEELKLSDLDIINLSMLIRYGKLDVALEAIGRRVEELIDNDAGLAGA